MKALFLVFLFASCAGLKTNHCSDKGAKNKAQTFAKNLEDPGPIDIEANSCDHTSSYSSKEYITTFKKNYELALRKYCTPEHISKLSKTKENINLDVCENYGDQRELKNAQMMATSAYQRLDRTKRQRQREGLSDMLLSQRAFSVKNKNYETTCELQDENAIANILPLLEDETTNFNAFFEFEYYDDENQKIGSDKQHASITKFDFNSKLESVNVPRNAQSCVLTYLDSH
ncbi:MAG: hypothetical protein CME64_05295 [Halobacteriovoraceae bacterium]|nr:hypothetical protein [Halobacteriovoraceae bacterium]|tara:strand:- start:282525 stop:283214 length:690 start_codon:yes stop_codon:yes gene_type:complete